jgi:hypothetical protein
MLDDDVTRIARLFQTSKQESEGLAQSIKALIAALLLLSFGRGW